MLRLTLTFVWVRGHGGKNVYSFGDPRIYQPRFVSFICKDNYEQNFMSRALLKDNPKMPRQRQRPTSDQSRIEYIGNVLKKVDDA